MKIAIGSTRFVIVLWGFAIKFARVNFISAIINAYGQIKHGFLLYYLKNFTYRYRGTIQNCLFAGIMANINEYKYYRKTKLDILMPTYFSFFGFFNIQKVGDVLKMKSDDMWYQMECLINEAGWSAYDEHVLSESENFAKVNNRIKILDYGCLGTQKLLDSCGDKIYQEFDFSYSWEEEKKKLKQ